RLRIATHTSLHTTPRSTRTTLFPYTTLFRSKEAITRLRKTEEWTKDCWLWLYRGAWHEFEIHEIEMAVPLSPAEVIRKRHAIFRSEEHTSELQSRENLVCRLLLEKKKKNRMC